MLNRLTRPVLAAALAVRARPGGTSRRPTEPRWRFTSRRTSTSSASRSRRTGYALNAPRLPGGEEGIWVAVVGPADEVLVGLVVGRAVDGSSAGVELLVEVV